MIPDVRCAVPTQDGAEPPSLPYIHRAPTTWRRASTPTTSATTTFIARTVSKPSVVVPLSEGSCHRPNTPTRSATTAPAAKAANGTVMVLLSAMGIRMLLDRPLGNGLPTP